LTAAPDLYAILRVTRAATRGQIKSAYRRLAREFHPDVNADPAAADRFREATEAYRVLSDPARRELYDRWGVTAQPRDDRLRDRVTTWGDDDAFE
jgi:curved DNA-binding protein